MENSEAIEMMRRSSEEIKALRADVARLRPKADAYDAISSILGLLPRPSQGYGPDVAWMLDKRIDELRAELRDGGVKASPTEAGGPNTEVGKAA